MGNTLCCNQAQDNASVLDDPLLRLAKYKPIQNATKIQTNMYEEQSDEDQDVQNLDQSKNNSEKTGNRSSKSSSQNKNSSQEVTSSSSKIQKRTIVIDYGEHHRMSMREPRPLPIIDENSQNASNDDLNSLRINVPMSPNHGKRTMSKRSTIFPELAEQILLQNKAQLFKDEMLHTNTIQEEEFFQFELNKAYSDENGQFVDYKIEYADVDADSTASKHGLSRLQRKNHLEILLQKANSISGIRKLNLQFKQERRLTKAFTAQRENIICQEYQDLCEQFIEMLDFKRNENLQKLSGYPNVQNLLENIKSEIDYDMHCAIGLGNRMLIPAEIDGNYDLAILFKNQIYSKVVEIWQANQKASNLAPEKLLKIAQCAAEDDFFAQTGIEAETIEIVLNNNQPQSSDTQRTHSYADVLVVSNKSDTLLPQSQKN